MSANVDKPGIIIEILLSHVMCFLFWLSLRHRRDAVSVCVSGAEGSVQRRVRRKLRWNKKELREKKSGERDVRKKDGRDR